MILEDKLCSFIKGRSVEYMHFEVERSLSPQYVNFLWSVIKPHGSILNMGIMKKTPTCLSAIINNDSIKEILHIELDDPHKVKISPKEKILWKTDFLDYVDECQKSHNVFNGVVIWHGPEHLTKYRGMAVIKKCNVIAKNWILISCPWDRLEGWKQQPKGKEHLGHKSVWTEDDFLDLGFRVISFGERKIYPGYLVAWKIK
jgi:hypothetical protein